MAAVTPEQLALFDFPATPQFTVHLPPLRDPIWTENKARLIERYLYYFVLVTKHGIYVDGFAGPQKPGKPESWAAKLVLESEPKLLRKFFLYDRKPRKVRLLEKLKEQQPPVRKGESARTIEVIRADFNLAVHDLLASGKVGEREATFCLLDQQTFECHWSTVQALAHHRHGEFKIEIFYFFPSAWLDRAMAAQRDLAVLDAWWGSSEWQRLHNMKDRDRALLFCDRLKDELGYKSALPWSIYQRRHGGRVMYHMIHATDHPHAPNLMFRAYCKAVTPKERPERLQLEFEAWRLTGTQPRLGRLSRDVARARGQSGGTSLAPQSWTPRPPPGDRRWKAGAHEKSQFSRNVSSPNASGHLTLEARNPRLRRRCPGRLFRLHGATEQVLMSTKGKARKGLSEKDIDQLVVAQANNDSAWEKPIRVRRTKPASLAIPADLAARVAFLARLHRKTSAEEWLRHIIRERVELEEAAFVGAKHDLAAKTRYGPGRC